MARETLHNYSERMEWVVRRIADSPMSESNKSLLKGFDHLCIAQGLSLPRRVKLVEHILIFGTRYYHGSFKKATAASIWDGVSKIEQEPFTPWTKHDYKVAIRKFFKFVVWGSDAARREGLPEIVAGIKVRIPLRDRERVQANDILTESEVAQLFAHAQDNQERAMLAMIYELGARVSEIGTMRVGDVSRDESSFMCDVDGKTGPRSVRLILSDGALASWLNSHPQASNRSAPLWGRLRMGQWTRISYPAITISIRSTAIRAGITKRIYPHLFRHTRITHILRRNYMNEAQVKQYFGLSKTSNVLATYSHLLAADANDAALQMYGIAPIQEDSPLNPQRCGTCAQINLPASSFCARCGHALSVSAAEELADSRAKAEERMNVLIDRSGTQEELRRLIREEVQGLVAGSPTALRPQPIAKQPANPASSKISKKGVMAVRE